MVEIREFLLQSIHFFFFVFYISHLKRYFIFEGLVLNRTIIHIALVNIYDSFDLRFCQLTLTPLCITINMNIMLLGQLFSIIQILFFSSNVLIMWITHLMCHLRPCHSSHIIYSTH